MEGVVGMDDAGEDVGEWGEVAKSGMASSSLFELSR